MTSTETEDLVQYDCQDGIALIRLNRPHKLNAFSDETVRALIAAMDRFDRDDAAQVAVLSGNGRAFSSGADVHQRQLRTREELIALGGPEGRGARSKDVFTQSVNWKPVVSAVHGYVLGMAVNIALSCELVVAAEGTRFQVTEMGRGLGAATYLALLTFRGGGAFADEVALTGRYFTAEEALRANVINRVARPDELMAAALDLARQVAANPPLSVRSTVRSRRWALEQVQREAHFQSAPFRLHLSEDFRESARAFAEKRKAGPFTGR